MYYSSRREIVRCRRDLGRRRPSAVWVHTASRATWTGRLELGWYRRTMLSFAGQALQAIGR